MEDAHALPSKCARWRREVDRVMKRGYGIDTDDAGLSAEDVLRYWRGGDSPEAFVDWFAEKYDLTPRREWGLV